MNYNKIIALGTVLILTIGMASAQNQQQPPEIPGLVGPSSSLYGLQIAFDNAVYSPEENIERRIQEVEAVSNMNSSVPTQRAANALSNTAQQADESQEETIQQAMDTLDEVENKVPQQALQGIQNAQSQLEKAKQRKPETPSNPSETENNEGNEPPGRGGPGGR